MSKFFMAQPKYALNLHLIAPKTVQIWYWIWNFFGALMLMLLTRLVPKKHWKVKFSHLFFGDIPLQKIGATKVPDIRIKVLALNYTNVWLGVKHCLVWKQVFFCLNKLVIPFSPLYLSCLLINFLFYPLKTKHEFLTIHR